MNEEAHEDSNRAFSESLTDPKKVAAHLAEYNLWRRGQGRYMFSEVPEKNVRFPLSAKELGQVFDAAITLLMRM